MNKNPLKKNTSTNIYLYICMYLCIYTFIRGNESQK